MYSGDMGGEVIAVIVIAVLGAAMAARFDDPSYRPAALVREGDGLLSMGLGREALTRYERALWLQPRLAMAHLRIAQLRWSWRDIGGALDAAMTATECDPDLDAAHAMVDRVREAIDRR
jgi:tetratricopeptide (TPR) repeat protein